MRLNTNAYIEALLTVTNNIHAYVAFSNNNRTISERILDSMIYEISTLDLDQPPRNRLRKVIFKDHTGLSTSEKLTIVGQLIGRSKKIHQDDIYQCMLDINDWGKKITITRIAGLLDCSSRTIYRNMCHELKKEKELLNKQL